MKTAALCLTRWRKLCQALLSRIKTSNGSTDCPAAKTAPKKRRTRVFRDMP